MDNIKNENEINDCETVEIIGVRFRPVGKTYYFDPDGKKIPVGENVIVETSRGLEYGSVTIANRSVPKKQTVLPLKKVLRIATDDDKNKYKKTLELEEKARKIWEDKIKDYNLDMTLTGVEYTFDNTKLLFYFTAEGRIDFRDFVKELASVFKTRIELRQIGVRDEAKQIGGLGVCGRCFCCNTFLEDFQQVTIKMAKEQNLSLNSAKISGTCGRLMCCLRYENDVYEEEGKKCPRVDNIVVTPDGKGCVTEVNVLSGMVKVKLDGDPDKAPVTYYRDKLKVVGYRKDANKHDDIDEELKNLE